MTIRENLVAPSKYALKCPHAMTPIGVCIHNTFNDASAINENAYMISNTSQTSFHYAVDDKEGVLGIPLDRNGWHAGDGNGDGNRKHIGIEICYSKSGGDRFTKAEENAAELVAKILTERNWGVEVIKTHKSFSGKNCPHRTLDLGWDRLINMVKGKMGTMPGTINVPIADWEKVRGNSETLDQTTDLLALPRNSKFVAVKEAIDKKSQDSFNRGFAAGKEATPTPIEPPEEITLKSGRKAGLNGVTWSEGKLSGNYKLL